MNNKERYVIFSLELHLFFARIMKEHSLFLKAGFTPVDVSFANEAEYFKCEFEKLLKQAVILANGKVGRCILNSGELITEFTLNAEKQTQCFTGIPIDSGITKMESRLRCGNHIHVSSALCRQVEHLNKTAINLLDGLIGLKEKILSRVLNCQMFTMNYPLLLEHIIREAKLYRTFVCNAEQGVDLDGQKMKGMEMFWNQIMMEHALFIRGLLDPSEDELVKASDNFAKDYAALLSKSREACDETVISGESLKETVKFKEFKAAGTKGIGECKIRSVILPLLADHVLREANHYIRLLKN